MSGPRRWAWRGVPDSARRLASLVGALALLALLLGAGGCATARKRMVGVPIEDRPTPTPPPEETLSPPDTARSGRSASATRAPSAEPAPGASVEAVMSPEERQAAMERIVADTTAAGAAVRSCTGKGLLPDQESVFETTRSYLVQAHAALQRKDLWQAESLARKARQLALSLECH